MTLPFVFFTGMNMRKKLFPIAWVMMARTADIATVVEENVTGTRVVKSFAAEKSQLSVFDRAARRLRWAALLQVKNQAAYAPLMQAIPQLSLVIILLVGGYQVIEGNMTIGTFLVFNTYVVMLQIPFMMVGMVMMMTQRAKAAGRPRARGARHPARHGRLTGSGRPPRVPRRCGVPRRRVQVPHRRHPVLARLLAPSPRRARRSRSSAARGAASPRSRG